MAARASRPLRALPVVGLVVRWYEERLTTRGRFLLAATLALGLMDLDTRRTQVYVLFAVALATLAAARVSLFRPPRARLDCPLPERATAGMPVTLRARVTAGGGAEPDLCLS